MVYYLNAVCPLCEKPISDEAELVVCPECGTPHHRACYFENSHCFNQSLHDDGFEWKAPSAAEPDSTADNKICPHCGKEIPASGVYCNYCGNPVTQNLNGASFGKQFQQRVNPLFVNAAELKYDPEEKIDGIPIRDWMVYIGSSYNYYLYNFKIQDKTNRKTAFTLSAVVFPFLYFLYRRVWGAAIISAITNLLLNLPYLILTVLIPLGIDLGISVVSLNRVTSLFSVLSFAVNLCWGIFAVWLYRKKAVKHMNQLKYSPEQDDEQYKHNLLRFAGPSKTAVIIVGAVFIGIIIFTFVIAGIMSL